MNSKYYKHYSIQRSGNKFQVYFDGKLPVYRDYNEGELLPDPRFLHDTFASAQEFVRDEVVEQEVCDAEAAQERYIAMNYDECGRPFRCGEEW